MTNNIPILSNIMQHSSRILIIGNLSGKVKAFFFNKFIEEQLIYNVVLVSGVEQSEQVIPTYVSTLSQTLFPYRSLQSTEYSSLCYTVCPYQSSILYIVVCICQSPNLSLSPLSPSKHKFVFYICNFISVLQISSFVPFFFRFHI